ncbi:ligand-binding sensor domain-containing diguanylate cyclase [Capsulimonas corticalis]|uniref:ligand-binding sensor domain-containing diguanylate cyclase n=1 Tax=Capsulimonas corticalis TaxID=2219043 RepID=UPI002633DE87|nr:diguanylate cyclase [Capsulimonas corticalis]
MTLLLILCYAARVQASPFSLKSSVNTIWRTPDGMPQDRVNAILQSRDGYLWLATQDGLARFDGDRFTILDTENTPGLATNGIEQLMQDSTGALWAAGAGGISRIQNGVAVNLTPVTDIESEVRVTCQLDPTGTLWAEKSGGFYQSVNGRLKEQFSVAEYAGQIIVKHWAVGPNGLLWVEQDDGGLLEVHAGKMIHIAVPGAEKHLNSIRSIQCDGNGVVWVGTELGAYTIRNAVLTPVPGQSAKRAAATIRIDHAGDVWGLIGGTLCQFHCGRFLPTPDWQGISVGGIDINSGGDLICRYGDTRDREHPYDGIGLKISKTFVCIRRSDGLAGVPTCTIRDTQGGVWVGTDNGLDCLRDGNCHTFTERQGLPDTPIQCLFTDAANHLWASAGADGLYRNTGEILGRFQRIGGPDTRITALCQTSYGEILGLWKGRAQQLIGSRTVDVGAKYGNALVGDAGAIAVSDDGDVWLMGDHEFVRTRGGHSVVVPVSTAGNPIFAAIVDHAGRLWASGKNNLYCVENDRVQTFSSTEGVPNIPIVAMYADSDGALWFGHKGGGLTRYKNGAFRSITMRDGLYSDGVYQILEDDRHNLWIGSSRGVFRVSLDDLNQRIDKGGSSIRCYPFGPLDGASGGQAYTGRASSACRMRYADLWFSGMQGVVHIDSGNMESTPSPVLIEQIAIDGDLYSGKSQIHAPPGDGNAQFRFTALDYRNPSHLHFRFQLEGFDKHWRETDGTRTATYTNLPPGRYRFHVRCANTDSQWTVSTSIGLYLRPHYYQTWWFKGLCALAGIAMLAALVFVPILRRRNSQLHRMQERLAGQNDELTLSQNELLNSQQMLEAQNEELIAGQQELMESQQALEAANSRLRTLATTDGLTGITNHRMFQETLHGEWRRFHRENPPLSMLLIDVDHFKAFNDTYGHPAGDAVLIQVAALLYSNARDTDTVARYGGEEFVIILRNTDAEGARIVGERFRHAIASAEWPRRAITVSIGAATVCDSVASPESLIEAADAALYRSKKLGRNQLSHMFDTSFQEQDQAA